MKYIKKTLLIWLLLFSIGCLLSCKDDNTLIEEPTTYNITFDLNGGLFKEDVTTTYTDGKDYKLPHPFKNGYEFIGWYEILEDNTLSNYEVTYLNNRDYNLKATWTKAYDSTVLNDLFTTVKKNHKNIIYKTIVDVELKLDIYLPAMEEGKKYPVLFFFFGGGWFMGDKSYISYYNVVLKNLADEGFIVVAPNYRLVGSTGDPHYPLPVEDCFDAIRYIVKYQEEIHADVNNMGAFGHSAGGYFALMAAFAQNHFKGDEDLSKYDFKLKYAIALSAPSVYDRVTLAGISLTGQSMLAGYFGVSNLKDDQLASGFPSYYLSENKPIIYLVHGTADELVPVSQSRDFFALAKVAGIDVNLIEIENANHTYDSTSSDVTENYNAAAKVLRDFIISQK